MVVGPVTYGVWLCLCWASVFLNALLLVCGYEVFMFAFFGIFRFLGWDFFGAFGFGVCVFGHCCVVACAFGVKSIF